MKRITKWIVSFCFGLVCSASLALGVANMSTETASAAEPTVTANIEMLDGASVRIGDSAIRFQTYVKKSYYDGLINKETGVYFIPADLASGELTNETPQAMKVKGYASVKSTDTHYIYNYVLYDIPESSYGRDILARGYIKDGDTYVWAENPQMRSLAYVASAALEEGVNSEGVAFEAEDITYLNQYVDNAVSDFNISETSFALSVGATQSVTKSVNGIYVQDDLSDLKIKYTSDNAAVAAIENGKVVAKSAGLATITATLGSASDSFTVTVTGERQDLFLSDATVALDVSMPAGYSVTSIDCEGYDLGTNLSALTISDELKADLQNHGEKTVLVTVGNGVNSHILNVPVTLITSKITSLAEWQSAIQPTAEGVAKYGYYILANDISVNTNSISVLTANTTASPDGSDGFRGTIDGRGHELYNGAAWWKYGYFGEIGSGAVIKDITFGNTGLAAYGGERYLLARVAVGATFENVTINLTNPASATDLRYGVIFDHGARKCTFKNVTVNVTGTVGSVFGGNANITYWGLNGAGEMCTFEDCYVILKTAESSVAELGHRGDSTAAIGESTHIKYVAENVSTANGETALSGIQQYTAVSESVTLSEAQDVVVGETASLNLGAYADYDVQSITYNGNNLGNDASAFVLSESDKTKHGEGNTITVVASKVEKTVTITVPVTLITDVITTMDEFKAIMPTGATAVTNGYYVLGNDIGSADTVVDAGSRWFAAGVSALDGANYGFKATLDGRDHEIVYSISDADNQNNRYGLFGFVGTGAVIKNVVLTNTSVRPSYGTYMLAKSIDGATFKDVTFNLNNVQHRYANYGVFAQEIVNTTFEDVEIISQPTTNVYGNVNVLFTDSGESGNGIFSGNTFINTTVYLLAGASYTALAKNGTTVYTAAGLDVAGATVLEGITVSAPSVDQVELAFRQTINLEANNYALDLGEYAGYDVVSIKLGEYDLGTDVSALSISDALKADTKSHGLQDIIVTIDKGLVGTAVTVPVTMITSVINTADEFMAIMPTSASAVTYGYYVLGNDIGSADTVIGANGRNIGRNLSAVSAELGFRGTIDGRDYTFTFGFGTVNIDTGTTDKSGLFGFMGTGATVKNITFACSDIRTDTGTHFLGQNVQGATFENVTFEFTKVYSRYANSGILAPSITNSTFENVDIYVKETELKWAVTPMVFAGVVNGYDGVAAFSGNTFTNTNVYIRPGVSLAGIAMDGTTVYTAAGLTVDGATEVGGITVSTPAAAEVALDYRQDIYLEANAYEIDIASYSSYAVTSIKLGEYDLGTDVSALSIPDALKNDKSLHGEQNIIVTVEKGFAGTAVTVPVTLITSVIDTIDEFKAVMPTNTSMATYGYYVLGNDLGSEDTVLSASRITGSLSAVSAELGFRGTIDGRDHTFSFAFGTVDIDTDSVSNYNVFEFLGTDATVKNITFTCSDIRPNTNRHLLGQNVQGATFENVTFEFTKVYSRYANVGILAPSITNSTFENVDIHVLETELKWGVKPMVFAGTANAQYDGASAFSGNTFTNTNVYIRSGVSLAGMATDGTTVYTADGLTVDGATTVDGIKVTTVTLREETLTTRQDVILSAATVSLNLGAYSKYTINSITYTTAGGTVYDLGTNPSALTISDELLADLQNHGEQMLVVSAETSTDLVVLNVPVTLITAELTSLEEWRLAIQPTAEGVAKYGYYILANDISVATNSISVLTANTTASTDGADGFRGTIDGRDHMLYNNAAWWKFGYFGEIGSGAVIKNITFGTTGLAAYGGERYLLARVAIGATFENVTINLENLTSATNAQYGVILDHGARNTTFTNVTINVTGTLASVFGGTTSQYWGLNVPGYECTFTDCNVYLKTAESSITELGHCLNSVYVAKGMSTANGEYTIDNVVIHDSEDTAWLLNDGTSMFTIVKPKNASTYMNAAADELVKLFEEATGVTLAVITDDSVVGHDSNSTYISLGNTVLYKTAGLSLPSLKEDGFYLKTLDRTIYLVGGSETGVLYGVYDLLSELFGFEMYYQDCYALNTSLTSIKLPNYDKVNNPAIDMRSQAGQLILANQDHYADRFASTDYYWGNLLPIINAEDESLTNQGHNSLYYLPKNLYYSTYPEFYSNNSTWEETGYGVAAQLCYTAHGNATSYNKMVQLCAERIEASLKKYTPIAYPNYNSVVLGLQDNYLMCTCDACNAVVSEYGSLSATVIIFLNDVAELVDAWMENNSAYARDLQYMFFAYQQALATPTKMPDVTTKIAPFVAASEMNFSKAANDTTANSQSAGGFTYSNAQVLAFMKTWGEFAKDNGGAAWSWLYGNFFRDYFCFYDWTDFYSTIFPYLSEYGYEFVYVQQQSDQNGAYSAFMGLNAYVSAKLMWDPTLDMDTLVSEYMTAMYADAADEMMAIFTRWQEIFADKSMGNLTLGNETPGKKLTAKLVDELLTLFDAAYAAIADYETSNPELYAKVKKHIDMEWLSPAKLAIVDFKSTFNSTWQVMIQSLTHKYADVAPLFETIVSELGITHAGEEETINTIIDSL